MSKGSSSSSQRNLHPSQRRDYGTTLSDFDQGQHLKAWKSTMPARKNQPDHHRSNSSSSVNYPYASPPTPDTRSVGNSRTGGQPPSFLSDLHPHSSNTQSYTHFSDVLGHGHEPTAQNELHDQKPAASCVPTADLFEFHLEQKWSESPVAERKGSFTRQDALCLQSGSRTTKHPTLPRNTRTDAGVQETAKKLRFASLEDNGELSKKWCLTHCLYDTCRQQNETARPTGSRNNCVSPNAFADFVARQNALRAAHTSEQDERRRHDEWRQRMSEKEKRLDEKCKLLSEQNLRRKAAASSLRDVPYKVTSTKSGFEACTSDIVETSRKDPGSSHSSESKAEAKNGFRTENPATLTSRYEGRSPPSVVLPPSPAQVQTEHSVREAKAWPPNPPDLIQAAKIRKESATRIREAVKILVAKKEVEVKWTSVELSDDEDWEQVDDESAEWEVLER